MSSCWMLPATPASLFGYETPAERTPPARESKASACALSSEVQTVRKRSNAAAADGFFIEVEAAPHCDNVAATGVMSPARPLNDEANEPRDSG